MKIKLNIKTIQEKSIHFTGMLLFIFIWILLSKDIVLTLWKLSQHIVARESIEDIASLTCGLWLGLVLIAVVNKQQNYLLTICALIGSSALRGLDNVLFLPESSQQLNVANWFFFPFQPYLSFGVVYLMLLLALYLNWKKKQTYALKLLAALLFINMSFFAIEKTVINAAYEAISEELHTRLDANYVKTCQGYNTYCAIQNNNQWQLNKDEPELLKSIQSPTLLVHTTQGNFLMMKYKNGYIFSKGALDAEEEYQKLVKEVFLGIVSIFLLPMVRIKWNNWKKHENQS